MSHNVNLKPWNKPKPNAVAGKGNIEIPSQVKNIVWQTRAAPPTEYETRLADALEVAFDAGIDDLDGIVAKLNELGVQTQDGQAWTVDAFTAEVARLGY
jgi:hypothetical protein